MEERLHFENLEQGAIKGGQEGKAYHARKHATQTPHVEGVVVLLKVHQKLGTFEVARRNSHIVLHAGVVELGQAPVNQTKLPTLVVNHDVVWFHVAVHDAPRVTKVEGEQQLVNVEPDVQVRELGVERLKVDIVDVLKDQRWCL